MTLGFDQLMRKGGDQALREMARFQMREGSVHEALKKITRKLEELEIPYAVAGGMALVAHGYPRTTVDVDLLVTPDGLKEIHKALDGLGYIPPFAGSKNLRDTELNVRIEFLISGQFPGDGKPKPVPFPDPQRASVEIDGVRYLSLPALVELKIASGTTGGTSRLKDLADVVELIRSLQISRDFTEQLNEFVQPKFLELWDGLHGSPDIDH